MNLYNSYYYFKSALSPKFCDDVIEYGLQQKEVLGITGGYEDKKLNSKQLKKLKKLRHSDLVWLNENWIYKELHPFVRIANRMAGWNFQWDRSEQIQFTKYKLNQYYGWHQDAWRDPYGIDSHPNLKGKIRKLSVSVSLSDPKDYEGGEFEFDYREQDPDKPQIISKFEQLKAQGTILVFPSHTWHRVKPVTKGTRYSLVLWTIGKPFR